MSDTAFSCTRIVDIRIRVCHLSIDQSIKRPQKKLNIVFFCCGYDTAHSCVQGDDYLPPLSVDYLHFIFLKECWSTPAEVCCSLHWSTSTFPWTNFPLLSGQIVWSNTDSHDSIYKITDCLEKVSLVSPLFPATRSLATRPSAFFQLPLCKCLDSFVRDARHMSSPAGNRSQSRLSGQGCPWQASTGAQLSRTATHILLQGWINLSPEEIRGWIS